MLALRRAAERALWRTDPPTSPGLLEIIGF